MLKTQCILFLISACLFAQGSQQHQYFDKGSRALQFGLTGSLLELRLGNFNGSLISAKYHFSKKKAINFGIGLAASTEAYKNSDHTAGDSVDFRDKHFQNTDSYTLNLHVQYVWYFQSSGDIFSYLALGPAASVYSFDADPERGYDRHYPYDRRMHNESGVHKSRQYFTGVRGSFGIEWFIKSNMCLIFEYGAKAGYAYTNNTVDEKIKSTDGFGDRTRNDREKRKTMHFTSDMVRMGVSFYFE